MFFKKQYKITAYSWRTMTKQKADTIFPGKDVDICNNIQTLDKDWFIAESAGILHVGVYYRCLK